MAQPPQYTRTKNFADDFGHETDHSALNAELDKASNSINDIRKNLAILQADDGKLRPNVVTYDSLSDDLIEGISSSVTQHVQESMDTAVVTINTIVSEAESSVNESVQQAQSSAEQAASIANDSLINAHSSQESAFASASDAESSANSAIASASSASESAESSKEAYAWANTPENEIVSSAAHPGKYSAYHYARKAELHLEAATTAHRGTYYNAFDAGSHFYEVRTVAIENGGSGYKVGNVAVILMPGAEYPVWVVVRSINSSGAVTSIELSSAGIFSERPENAVYQTSSDGGSGLTIAITTTEGEPSTLRSIDNPQPNQTATVLHNERMGGTAWTFIYADRNGDGVFNWIEMIQITSLAGDIPDDEQTITSVSGVRSLTTDVKSDIASAVAAIFPSGTQMLFIQAAAPTGWTKVTDHNDKALRIVSGSGGGAGGSTSFSATFAASRAISGSVGNTTLAEWQIPSHNHTLREGPTSGGWTSGLTQSKVAAYQNTDLIAYTGGNGAHNHSLTMTTLNMAVQYVDAIIARKD